MESASLAGLIAVLGFLMASSLSAQRDLDDVLWQVRREVLLGNRAASLVTTLSDVFGPRLTGSPVLGQAREWVQQQMILSGLGDVKKDPWTFGNPGWANERVHCGITAPNPVALPCAPVAWTPGTSGTAMAEVALIRLPLGMPETQLTEWFDREKPRLEGRIVLLEAPMELPRIPPPPEIRLEFDKLSAFRASSLATRANTGRVKTSGGAIAPLSVTSYHALIDRLLVRAGVVGRVHDSALPDGLLRAFANSTFQMRDAPPSVAIRNEDHSWMARLITSGLDVRMELTIENHEVPAGTLEFNLTGTLEGRDPAAGKIVVGAHLDTWHLGRGATDNAAGVAVVLEAARVLSALDGPRRRRTIQFAFWTGEEQGLLGSTAHVRRYVSGKESRPAAYINVDGGGGRIRAASVYADGHVVADKLSEVFTRLSDLDVVGAIGASGPGPADSDHFPFSSIGVPSIRFEHDPLRFRTHTWHTDIDTLERIVDAELNSAVIVLTAALLHLADSEF